MTVYGAPLNEDSNGKPTSGKYGDPGDGSTTWFLPVQLGDGSASSIGAKADTAVTASTSSASVIAALKGLLALAGVSTSSPAASAIANGSGNVANATAAATLVAGGASKRTWLTKLTVTGAGATAASVIAVTITGLTGGTRTYNLVIPAGVTTSIVPLELDWGDGFPASADNTAISVSVPAAGTGNTNMAVNMFGYVR